MSFIIWTKRYSHARGCYHIDAITIYNNVWNQKIIDISLVCKRVVVWYHRHRINHRVNEANVFNEPRYNRVFFFFFRASLFFLSLSLIYLDHRSVYAQLSLYNICKPSNLLIYSRYFSRAFPSNHHRCIRLRYISAVSFKTCVYTGFFFL